MCIFSALLDVVRTCMSLAMLAVLRHDYDRALNEVGSTLPKCTSIDNMQLG